MPNYYNPYYNPYSQPSATFSQPSHNIQSGGLVNVRSEAEARNYPVAPSTTVIFHNENEPYLYAKTVTSPLDAPRFEKYIRETKTEEATPSPVFVEKREFEALKADFDMLKERIDNEHNADAK